MLELITGKIDLTKPLHDKKSYFDYFIENMNALKQAGPGYIFITKYTWHEKTDFSGKSIDDESSIVVKLISVVPPTKGFWKNTPGSVTVQMTDGTVVPLFDPVILEKGRAGDLVNGNWRSSTGPRADTSYAIDAELEKYSRGKFYPQLHETYARFYSENDYKDMAELNKLVQEENKRRANLEKAKRESAAREAQFAAEQKAKDDALRSGAAQIADQFNKMFGK